MRYWFWVNIKGTHPLHYLVAAESSDAALEKIGRRRNSVTVTKASWRSIQKATGCKIPDYISGDSIANRAIKFETDTMSIRFWCG